MFSEIIYSWVFNEFPSFVAEDSRRFISQETGNLYISKVQPSDVGSYICLVKNAVTNARVLSPPTPLTLRNDGELPGMDLNDQHFICKSKDVLFPIFSEIDLSANKLEQNYLIYKFFPLIWVYACLEIEILS